MSNTVFTRIVAEAIINFEAKNNLSRENKYFGECNYSNRSVIEMIVDIQSTPLNRVTLVPEHFDPIKRSRLYTVIPEVMTNIRYFEGRLFE